MLKHISVLILLFGFSSVNADTQAEIDQDNPWDNYKADPSPTIDQIEAHQRMNEALKEVEKVIIEIQQSSDRELANCIKAFGHLNFCQCIFKELPSVWGFHQYISITTMPKEELGYDKMDDEYKKAFDSVRPIRDQCVEKMKF